LRPWAKTHATGLKTTRGLRNFHCPGWAGAWCGRSAGKELGSLPWPKKKGGQAPHPGNRSASRSRHFPSNYRLGGFCGGALRRRLIVLGVFIDAAQPLAPRIGTEGFGIRNFLQRFHGKAFVWGSCLLHPFPRGRLGRQIRHSKMMLRSALRIKRPCQQHDDSRCAQKKLAWDDSLHFLGNFTTAPTAGPAKLAC